ncbi:cyclic nucleotide-binding domain-containing protein 1 [Trachemys scripta elegans]|uniref:cyclic nucleotide-binding domain-containing protein 1 n=1 Tax=Trachemys scripta elegans TaxID=31138 RepID=UPI001555B446|nr:cyclic nucleotide-binding domain-containing protein 1 [Trachemys scripta elegans]
MTWENHAGFFSVTSPEGGGERQGRGSWDSTGAPSEETMLLPLAVSTSAPSKAQTYKKKTSKRVNYDQLDALCSISGLQNRKTPHTTEEAHQKFMKLYPKVFYQEKTVLPGIPPTLSKSPILRSVKEHNTVYEMMKLIPDIRAQLSNEELKELSMCTIKEYWAKGSTVVGNQGFYAILKGSARPQARCYKRMLGEDFDSSCVAMSPTSQATMFGFSGRTMLIRGSCFGTLETAPPKLPHILLSIITEENCEILKISSTDYLRIKEEIAKRERIAKEELIHGCPYYRDWPLLYVFQLMSHLKWRQFPAGYVLLKGGEISTFVGFIKSGYCNVYRETEALVKLPLGKMVKQTRQVLVGQLHEKQSFGEVSILLQTPFTCRVITATDVKLGIIDASAILGLDMVIQMLLLQTAEPTFYNITQDEINFEYINKEKHKEWQSVKNKVVQDILFHNGIIPGLGKWTHEWSHPAKRGKKSTEQASLNCCLSDSSV